MHTKHSISAQVTPQVSSKILPVGSYSDCLTMIDRVINWQELMRPLLQLSSQSDCNFAQDILMRSFVLRELPSVLHELKLDMTDSHENESEFLSFLKLSPGSQKPLDDDVKCFLSWLSSLNMLDVLRAELQRQLIPWIPWIKRQLSQTDAECVRNLLVIETSLAVNDLLKDLGQFTMNNNGENGALLVNPFVSLQERIDSIIETGFIFVYKSWQLIKGSRGHSQIIRHTKSQGRIYQFNKQLRKRLLPIFDKLLRAILRSISQNGQEKVQLSEIRKSIPEPSSRLSNISWLLRLRGQLFLASGDYERAYHFFLVAAAWGSADKGLLALYQAGLSAQLSGRFIEAENQFRIAILNGIQSPDMLRNFGLVLLVLGKEQEAYNYLYQAAQENNVYFMAHQNLAALYDTSKFIPRAIDLADYPQILLYDAYNLAGERLIHIGEGESGLRCFGAALHKQEELANMMCLSVKIRNILKDEYGIQPNEPIRILPYEWVTQIGHIAMLDSYLKLHRMGMSKPGRVLLLAPVDKVANQTYLNMWRSHVTVIESPDLIDELFAYQRCFGDCFNGYLRSDDSAGDWTELGALGQIAWDSAKREPLIKPSDFINKAGRLFLQKMGLTTSDWFVALHIRSTGYHNEGKSSMQIHRNASVEDYLPAIKAITDRGGWVIRMGDASMTPLPTMDRVIDYPHSDYKSEQCDIFLAASARFFIGTTSGLTNVVISLGTPCLLVNCVSNYFQLWNNRVLFTIKPLWNRKEQRYLNISEMTAENFRWKIFNINCLEALGVEPHANSSKEIEAATIEMLSRLDTGGVTKETEADSILKKLCERGGNSNFFGNGRLSNSFFLSRRTDLFLK